jgi:stage II sporulation protein D
MPASWGLEALKAQAVVARNYAYNSMKTTGFLYDDTRSQVYGGKSREDSRTNIAVSETKGIVMYNGTTIVGGYFSSSNGGHTAQGSEVWSNDLPYLKSVADPYDSYNNPNSHWSTKIANDTISAKLGLTGYSKIVSLKVTKATAYGRAQQVTAVALDPTTGNTKSYTLPSGSPDGLRSAFGVSLKSTMFTITPQNTSAQIMMADGTVITVDYLYGSPIKTATDSTVNLLGNIVSVQDADKTYNQNLYPLEFTFNGSGYGHGLGLSQYGANGMAAKGFGYKDILKFYFNNITFKTIE